MKSNILQRLFLTLTLCLVGIVVSWADDNTYTRDGIIYTLDEANSTASVTGYEKGITTANIRSRVAGCAVTSIGMSAFYGCSSLTSVSIPSSVTSIGEWAFSDCFSLTSVNIPSSVTSIGRFAFRGCSSLTSVSIPSSVTSIGMYAFYGCSSLTSVSIPSSVTSIGELAFSDCFSLTSVSIPSSVTSIGGSAFSGCSSLTSVSIPSSVTSIGGSAFSGCSSLTSVSIPSSVTSIGESAFSGCSSLTSVTISPDNKYYVSDGSAIYNKEKTKLIMVVGGIKKYDIPSSVTSIGWFAFRGCSSLTSVSIPSSVTSICGSAFYGCSSLTSVSIPFSVTSIGMSAFYGCSSLTSVSIPSSVTSIGRSAFDGCSSLTSVSIPSSVTSIDEFAFYGCSSLTSVKILSPVIKIGTLAFHNIDDNRVKIVLSSSEIEMTSGTFLGTSVLFLPNSDSFSIKADGEICGDWYFTENVYNQAVANGCEFSSPHILQSDVSEIIEKREDALSFISQRKNIYNVIDSKLRTNLDNVLDQTSDYFALISKQDSELAALKADLTTAFNDVRDAIYDQMDLNYDLSDIYKQAESIASDERISENKAFGFPYADFNAAFGQAKKELDGVCATQNTIDRLQEVVDVINGAAKVDFAKSEYLTLYSNKALVVPEGMKAAVVVDKAGGIRNDYRYGSGATIPACTGVLLKGESGYLGYLLEGTSTESAPADNLLHGTLSDEMTDVEGTARYYKLAYDRDTKSVIGFYWGATNGAAFVNKAGKAFLAIPASATLQQIQGISLADMDRTDGVTGIVNNATAASASFKAFDINGRRVDAKSMEDLKPGIYVVNGKKVIK